MNEIRRMETAAEKAAAAQFAERAGALPGASWVRKMRNGAMARFADTGLPHRRIEEWKYTDLRAAVRELPPPAAPADGASVSPDTLKDVAAWRAVIADGGAPHMPEVPPAGVEVESLEAALARDDAGLRALIGDWPDGAASPVFDLNTAFMQAGLVIRVTAGTTLEIPLHLAFVTTGQDEAAIYGRNVIVLEDGASATIVESYEGPDGIAYQVNVATRFSLGDGARLSHVKVQREGDAAVHLGVIGGDIAANAQLTVAPFTIGARLSRTNVALRFDGPDAVGNLAGVHILGGRQHADMTLYADHRAPACAGRDLFKSVLDGRARGVFQGLIVVRPDAQKTDAKMMSQALMLSDGAEADNKPELEIYADDVQCGHGATSGQLDENLLFYLRSRGIPEPQAQALLIESFIGEAIDAIGHENIQEALSAYAHKWVAARKDVPE